MNQDFNQNNFNESINDNNTITNSNINTSNNVSINNDTNMNANYVPPVNNTNMNNNSNKNGKNKTILIIIIAIAVFLFQMFIVTKIISYLIHIPSTPYEQSQTETTNDNDEIKDQKALEETEKKDYSNLYGKWLSSGGSYFVFNENNTFYWYASKDDLNDNYYYGNLEILNASEALDDLGISYAQMLETIILSKGQVSIYNVYSIKCLPTYLISGGVDKTSTNLTQDGYFKLLFVIIDDKNAQGYNYNTSDKYYLVKE